MMGWVGEVKPFLEVMVGGMGVSLALGPSQAFIMLLIIFFLKLGSIHNCRSLSLIKWSRQPFKENTRFLY